MAASEQRDLSLVNGVFCTVSELFLEGRKARNLDLHHIARASVTTTGSTRSRLRGRGMEFFESRPYVPQDEMRTIDWKVSARYSKLFTKVFVEERDRPVYCVVDLRPSMCFGSRRCFKSVLAAHIAAHIAWAARNGGDKISGVVFGGAHEYASRLGSSTKSLAHFFGLLARGTKDLFDQLQPGPTNWLSVLGSLANRVRPGAVVFLLSDFLDIDEGARPLLFRLARKASVFALSIADPLEIELPALGRVGMAYGEERIAFDSNDAVLRKKYQAWWLKRQLEVTALFASVGIPCIKFSTEREPYDQLRILFCGRKGS